MRPDLEDSRGLQVTVLYLLYPNGPSYQRQKPIRALRQIVDRLPGSKSIVFIDNSIPRQAPTQIAENEFVLGGDNTYLEFSGWQKGLEFVHERGLMGEVCLFANDTLLNESIFHRRLVDAAALRCAVKYNAMVGKQMITRVAGEIFGNPLIPYIRTHLFMLPSRVLERLGSLLSLDARAIDQMFLATYDPAVPLFRADAPISKTIRDFVTSHLHRSWYRKMPYTAEHFDELRAKAISILNAFLLSMRVYQMGYPLISYARTSAFLKANATLENISAEWCDHHDLRRGRSEAAQNGANLFWAKGNPVYRHMPTKMRSFTLENILDFLERRSHPEHL
jgi:hypothetical protein